MEERASGEWVRAEWPLAVKVLDPLVGRLVDADQVDMETKKYEDEYVYREEDECV